MGLKHLWMLAVLLVEAPRQAAPPYVYTETARFQETGERFPAGARLVLVDGARRRALVPDFYASADPDISFDGKRILFAGKLRKTDTWQIWEAPISGGKPRKVTDFDEDAVTPHYLPEEKLAYARRTRTGFALEVMELAGGQTDRLTYFPGTLLISDILADGRILFEGPHPKAPREVYTIATDGSFLEAYRCDHGRDRHAGRQVASGDIIFQDGARLGRFTSALAEQVEVPLPAGRFAGPIAELGPGQWLVVAATSENEPLTLHRLDCASRKLEKVPGAPGTFSLQPVVVAERRAPLRHPSALMPQRGGANLLCLNAYVSKTHFAEGSIDKARFYTRNAGGTEQVLGEAKVERDGSFYVQLPPDQPVRLEVFDRAGRTLQAEHSWFSMRKGEQRVCVGCHAGPEQSPENTVPEVLLHSTVPVKLAGGH